MIKKGISIFLLALIFAGCTTWAPQKVIKVGIDPTFFTSPVGRKENLVYAYIIELFEDFFASTHYTIEFHQLSFDNLLDCIDDKNCDLVITSLTPHEETRALYDFSDPLINLGDVFITRKEDKGKPFAQFAGKMIALQRKPNIQSIFAPFPSIVLTFYTNISDTLTEIINYKLDGALIPILQLQSYLSPEFKPYLNFNPDKFYNNEAIRMISLKNQNGHILRLLNARLKSRSSFINHLLKKWELRD